MHVIYLNLKNFIVHKISDELFLSILDDEKSCITYFNSKLYFLTIQNARHVIYLNLKYFYSMHKIFNELLHYFNSNLYFSTIQNTRYIYILI